MDTGANIPESRVGQAGTRIIILGAGGHGRVVAEIVRRQYGDVIEGFVDDLVKPSEVDGIPVLGRLGDLDRLLKRMAGGLMSVVVGIGDGQDRRRVVCSIEATLDAHGIAFVNAVDPSAVVSCRAALGPGTVAMAHATINTGVTAGMHAVLNTACSVDHDCTIGDFAQVGPGAHLAGNVIVGEGALVGTGASVAPGVRIGAWTVIGAGSAVVRDVPEHVVSYGVPARVRREIGRELR